MNNNIQSFLCMKLSLRNLPACWRRYLCILGWSLWEFLMSLPHWTPGGISLTGFWTLHQDFWSHHMISKSNHREPFPHSLHTQEIPFNWPNSPNPWYSLIYRTSWGIKRFDGIKFAYHLSKTTQDDVVWGYPFLRKISVIFLISVSVLLLEQIISAQWVKHDKVNLPRLWDKESQLVYKPVFIYIYIYKIARVDMP